MWVVVANYSCVIVYHVLMTGIEETKTPEIQSDKSPNERHYKCSLSSLHSESKQEH